VLEAQACGLPAIVAGEGGPCEIVRADHSGLVIDISRPDALAEAMRRLFLDEGLRRELGRRGLERAQACGWEQVLARLREVRAAERPRPVPDATARGSRVSPRLCRNCLGLAWGSMSNDLEPQIRATQIIAAALIVGPLLMLGVSVYLRSQPGSLPEPPDDPLITWVAAAYAVLTLPVHFVLTSRNPHARDVVGVRKLYIARLAVTEAASLFGSVAYMIEEQGIALAVAAAPIFWMAAMQFPTRNRLAESGAFGEE